MLGPDQRDQLPALYLTARKNRKVFPAWLHVIWVVPFLILLIVMLWTSGSVPVLYVCLAVVFASIYFGRRVLIRNMLARRRGRVCPCCWRSSDRPRERCRGCHVPGGEEAHRIYWRIARLHTSAAEQWFGDRYRIEGKRPPMTWTFRLVLTVVIAVPTLALIWILVRTIYFNDLGWLGGGFGGGLFWLFYLPAGWLSVRFARRRAGKTRHCASCEYQMAPVGSLPDACPECGSELSSPGAIVTGRRIGSKWPAVAMICTFFFLFAIIPFAGIFSGSQFSSASLVPTDTLIQNVLASDEPEWHVWRELETRSLSSQHIEDLLDELELMLEGKTKQKDDSLWDYKVDKLIAQAARQGVVPHTIEVRLLELYHAHDYDLPYSMREWVDDALKQGVFTQAELAAAEMHKPIKQATTDALVTQVIAKHEPHWEADDELRLRGLGDHQVEELLDEMERRLKAGQDFGMYGDPTGWGRSVADLLVAEAIRRQLPRPIALRLLMLDLEYQERLPYVLRRWVKQAKTAGLFKFDNTETMVIEPAPADE